MPQQVDHEERRRLIADAVCRLADAHGLEGVTLRDVAATADVSMGSVQRCFRTKEEMLSFVVGNISERVVRRARAHLGASSDQPAGTTLVRIITAVAPLDPAHRADARVRLAFLAQAAVSPGLAQIIQAGYSALEETLTQVIATATEATYPACEARTLLALADGLTTHILIGHLSPEDALAVLDAHVSRLVTGHRSPGLRSTSG